MISAKGLSALAAVAVVVLVAAFYSQKSEKQVVEDAGRYLPDLMDRANEVAKITIKMPDGTVTLSKRESRWVVEEKHNYPASPQKIRSLVLGLAELRRIEGKTSNPELYAKLGLRDVTVAEAQSTLIQLQNDRGEDIATLMVGKQKPAGVGRNRNQYYVRSLDDPQAWLTEGKLTSARKPQAWIDPRVLFLDGHEIRSVSVVHPDGERVHIARKDKADEDFVLEGLSGSQEVESAYAVNSIARTLRSLSADDVRQRSEADNLDGATRVELTTFDKLRIQLALSKQDDQVYAQVTAAADEDADNEIKKQGAELNEHWRKWTYVIPGFQFDAVTVKKADLIKSSEAKTDSSPAESKN